MLRQSIATAGLALLVLGTGCRSFRPGPQSTATVPQQQSIAETQVAGSHLIDIGDLLREQGQFAQAAEMYRLALKRDPGNALAKKGLDKLPVHYRTERTQPQPVANRPAEPPGIQPTELKPGVPPAPGVPDVPAIQEESPKPAPSGESLDVSAHRALRSFESASQLPRTLVKPNSGERDEHVIQIIPATKSGRQRSRKIRIRNAAPRTTVNRDGAIQKTSIPAALRLPGPKPTPALRIVPATHFRGKVTATLVTLTGFADAPQDYLPEIAERFDDPSPHVRALAAYLTGRAGGHAHELAGRLQELLHVESHGPTKIRVAEALLRIVPDDEAARRTIAEGLTSSNIATRWEAVCVAGVVSRLSERDVVLARLLDRLDDVNARVREMAALVAGDFRNDSARVIAALDAALVRSPTRPRFREAAAITLAAMHAARRPAAHTPAARKPVKARRPTEAAGQR